MSASDVSYEDEKAFDKPEEGWGMRRIKERFDARFECARLRCPMNRDGEKCVDVTAWQTCRRQIEP